MNAAGRPLTDVGGALVVVGAVLGRLRCPGAVGGSAADVELCALIAVVAVIAHPERAPVRRVGGLVALAAGVPGLERPVGDTPITDEAARSVCGVGAVASRGALICRARLPIVGARGPRVRGVDATVERHGLLAGVGGALLRVVAGVALPGADDGRPGAGALVVQGAFQPVVARRGLRSGRPRGLRAVRVADLTRVVRVHRELAEAVAADVAGGALDARQEAHGLSATVVAIVDRAVQPIHVAVDVAGSATLRVRAARVAVGAAVAVVARGRRVALAPLVGDQRGVAPLALIGGIEGQLQRGRNGLVGGHTQPTEDTEAWLQLVVTRVVALVDLDGAIQPVVDALVGRPLAVGVIPARAHVAEGLEIPVVAVGALRGAGHVAGGRLLVGGAVDEPGVLATGVDAPGAGVGEPREVFVCFVVAVVVLLVAPGAPVPLVGHVTRQGRVEALPLAAGAGRAKAAGGADPRAQAFLGRRHHQILGLVDGSITVVVLGIAGLLGRLVAVDAAVTAQPYPADAGGAHVRLVADPFQQTVDVRRVEGLDVHVVHGAVAVVVQGVAFLQLVLVVGSVRVRRTGGLALRVALDHTGDLAALADADAGVTHVEVVVDHAVAVVVLSVADLRGRGWRAPVGVDRAGDRSVRLALGDALVTVAARAGTGALVVERDEVRLCLVVPELVPGEALVGLLVAVVVLEVAGLGHRHVLAATRVRRAGGGQRRQIALHGSATAFADAVADLALCHPVVGLALVDHAVAIVVLVVAGLGHRHVVGSVRVGGAGVAVRAPDEVPWHRVRTLDDALEAAALTVALARLTHGDQRLVGLWIASPVVGHTIAVVVDAVADVRLGHGLVAAPADVGAADGAQLGGALDLARPTLPLGGAIVTLVRPVDEHVDRRVTVVVQRVAAGLLSLEARDRVEVAVPIPRDAGRHGDIRVLQADADLCAVGERQGHDVPVDLVIAVVVGAIAIVLRRAGEALIGLGHPARPRAADHHGRLREGLDEIVGEVGILEAHDHTVGARTKAAALADRPNDRRASRLQRLELEVVVDRTVTVFVEPVARLLALNGQVEVRADEVHVGAIGLLLGVGRSRGRRQPVGADLPPAGCLQRDGVGAGVRPVERIELLRRTDTVLLLRLRVLAQPATRRVAFVDEPVAVVVLAVAQLLGAPEHGVVRVVAVLLHARRLDETVAVLVPILDLVAAQIPLETVLVLAVATLLGGSGE